MYFLFRRPKRLNNYFQHFTDLNAAMLCQGNGASFVPVPSAGYLPPFGEEVIEVTAYADMWGEYRDALICKVKLFKSIIIRKLSSMII